MMFTKMGVLLLLVTVVLPVMAQEEATCYGAGSVAGAAIGAFLGALLLVAVGFYLRKLYWRSREGKHLVFSTDPESVKDEFAFDNPGYKHEERRWQHEAPTLPLGGKTKPLQAEFVPPDRTRDDMHVHRGRTRRVKLWARDFTGLGLRCGGGARDGVCVHSVLRSGPAAAANLQPGDKIKSIKIEFTGTPLDDAVAILSLASPYPVELEVVEGGRASGAGRGVYHPILKKAVSTSDVHTLEKETKHLLPPKSPNTTHSNHSTLDNKQPKPGIKKIIQDIANTTLERNKKERKEPPTTLERENEKNSKMTNKSRHSDVLPTSQLVNKPDRLKNRYSTGSDLQMTHPEHTSTIEHAEVQKRENDPKKGMKFGIRVLPPNVPDDGVLRQKSIENGSVAVEKKHIDEPDKPDLALATQVKHENEVEVKKPVVAKRREKMAPPIPNVRTKIHEVDHNSSQDSTKSELSTFARNDLNSSGIKRDENGIPQELPQHMFDAAKAARNNRKSSSDLIQDVPKEVRKEEAPKPKKSKGKAPTPPVLEKNKTDDSIIEQLKNVNDFLKNEKQHSSLLHDSSLLSDKSTATVTTFTSTPKVNKTLSRVQDESIKFTQEDIDDIISKPFKRESDSLNNYFEDSKSNLSSNQDVHSFTSFNNSDKSEKGSTTIELNNSDITIHSSPLNDTAHSNSDEASILDENERKAASLGDLSRFELRIKPNSQLSGTLERAQSLDISADDTDSKENTLSPKKRKANSVVETTFYDTTSEDILPEMVDSERGVVVKNKEPRLSLNMAKSSAMEGLNTFQRNRLKKGSEFGNLEDAIVKGSSSSIDSEKTDSQDKKTIKEFDLSKDIDDHETSDHLARRIMDENMKVHLKLVSEFAKSTSDESNMNSLDSSRDATSPIPQNEPKQDEKQTVTYQHDTNIPDDMKVSRNSYANSLERPKSDMMKKLLAKNPILNVHIDKTEPTTSKVVPTPMSDSSKSAIHQPDIVNFNLKTERKNDYDDFVSNIRVGSNNNTLNKQSKPEYSNQWSDSSKENNVVTISTKEKEKPENKFNNKSYTKSIEIGEPTRRLIPDVLEEIRKRGEEREQRTLYMEPSNVSITMKQEPVQKTVTVNVAEDEFGNKVITQNVEKVSNKYINTKAEAPLQIEQVTFGIMKGTKHIDELALEEGDVKEMDKKILEEIKKQNPNMHFTTDEPAYTKTETIILNTELDQDEAMVLMEKLKNDPSFMAQKTPEELSKLGIRIIRDLDDTKIEEFDTVEVTKTKYSINPTAITDKQCEDTKDHITEIQVVTPRTEKMIKQKSQDKIASRQRAPTEEANLSYELDANILNDFISNERNHSAKVEKQTQKEEPKKHHSDFDLPRNTSIQFRTATYESPKGTIVTSTDLENRRLSQLDQMQLRGEIGPDSKPVILAKPSNIPVKTEKTKQLGVNISSKIPVFMTQKSLSQENLTEKSFSLPRSPPPALSSSQTNISVTSIKNWSKNPSGKL